MKSKVVSHLAIKFQESNKRRAMSCEKGGSHIKNYRPAPMGIRVLPVESVIRSSCGGCR
jgi:hypothetical protein